MKLNCFESIFALETMTRKKVHSEQTYQTTKLYDQFINELKSVWMVISWKQICKSNTADFEQAKLQQAVSR